MPFSVTPQPGQWEGLAWSEEGLQGAAEIVRMSIDGLYPQQLGESVAREFLACRQDCVLPPGTVARVQGALVDPVRYLIEEGGARWRPYLIAAAIDALGGDSTQCGPLLAALEVMHTGSLMVDDLQDGSVVRRGVAAAHVAFDPALVLNAGTAAFFVLDRALRLVMPTDPRTQVSMYQSYMGMLRSAHAGQALDIAGLRTVMDAAVAGDDGGGVLGAVRLTHTLKSGAPVRCFMELGAYGCGASTQQREALARFGEAIGTAYQITDDVQDLTGVLRSGAPTKQVGEDLRNGKVTMPLAHAVDLLPQPDMAELWSQVRQPGTDRETVDRAIKVLTSCGAVHAAAREADELVEAAWSGLEPLLPASAAVERLRTLAQETVRRTRLA